MRNLKYYLMASASVACLAAEPAQAQYAFGAGATFPSKTFRQLMDCMYSQAQGALVPPPAGPMAKAAACPAFNLSGFGGLILYAPTGSSNGKATLLSNSPLTIGAPSTSSPVPWTDHTLGFNSKADYDGVQFAGTDATYNTADMVAWNGAPLSSPPAVGSNQDKFGNLIAVPAFSGGVTVALNGKDGTGAALTVMNPVPVGGTSGVNLSRNALCGIFSGHISKWDNAILTALNGGAALGTGQITVVHRSDGSGTTFVFTNALATQCQFEFGPSDSGPGTFSYAFPWREFGTVCGATYIAKGAERHRWPDLLTDECGLAIPSPAGSLFDKGSGNAGVAAKVVATDGALGYVSNENVAPFDPTGPISANIQSQWDLTAATGLFQPVTIAGIETAMASATPTFTAATRHLPLAWALQGVVPNPSLPGAFPIAGFTWMGMYQCYAPHGNGNAAFLWFRIFLNFMYGSPDAYAIVNENGFAMPPFAWLVEISTLLNDPTYQPNLAGVGGCVGKVGAY